MAMDQTDPGESFTKLLLHEPEKRRKNRLLKPMGELRKYCSDFYFPMKLRHRGCPPVEM